MDNEMQTDPLTVKLRQLANRARNAHDLAHREAAIAEFVAIEEGILQAQALYAKMQDEEAAIKAEVLVKVERIDTKLRELLDRYTRETR